MKVFVFSLFVFLCLSGFAQPDVKLFAEKKNDGFILYVFNNEFCPVSVTVSLDLENLKFDKSDDYFVVPAKDQKFKIGELTVIDKQESYRYKSQYKYYLGDIALTVYDSIYTYSLPYDKGKRFQIFQGYNGNQSHQNENSLDFVMPIGTAILAAREGTIVSIVQNNTQACALPECVKFNNYVIIYHPDGTFTEYTHIMPNSVTLKIGDYVEKGTLIAQSGNTGWSTGPHLHFICFLPRQGRRESIKTLFKVANSKMAQYLQESKTYHKDY